MQPFITSELTEQVNLGAVLAISISGGKDSQALLVSVLSWYKANNLTNKIFAIHADLGRAEWAQTNGFVRQLCETYQIELVEVFATHNGQRIDLLNKIELRQAQLEAQARKKKTPIYPSFQQRYCTSDLKTDPINAYLKQFPRFISIEGIRWDESKARSQKPIFERRAGFKKKGGSMGFTWNAIINYTEQNVLEACGMTESEYNLGRWQYKTLGTITNDWKIHPAYAMGNTRLSCAICVLASRNDFLNGIKHNPELADWIHQKEQETGFSYQQGITIQQGRARLAAEEEQMQMIF